MDEDKNSYYSDRNYSLGAYIEEHHIEDLKRIMADVALHHLPNEEVTFSFPYGKVTIKVK